MENDPARKKIKTCHAPTPLLKTEPPDHERDGLPDHLPHGDDTKVDKLKKEKGKTSGAETWLC